MAVLFAVFARSIPWCSGLGFFSILTTFVSTTSLVIGSRTVGMASYICTTLYVTFGLLPQAVLAFSFYFSI